MPLSNDQLMDELKKLEAALQDRNAELKRVRDQRDEVKARLVKAMSLIQEYEAREQ